MCCKESELKSLTERYWEENWEPDKYIEQLLPMELKYIKEKEKLNNYIGPEILVLLVGFSWEPLLISLCIHRPKYLVLILNENYGDHNPDGAARGEDFKELIDNLKNQNLLEETPEILPQPWELVKDSPEDVFKFLKRHVLPEVNKDKKVLIDITGAKKSMVAGAYLFAAYSDTPVFYLDFDEYCKKYARPYGYTCKIGSLENPMELFRLRDWEQVKQLYEHYAFWSAKKLIAEIEKGTKLLLEAEETGKIETLTDCLEFYGLWDDGNYKEALLIYEYLSKKGIELTPPTAVEKLGGIWPDREKLIEDIICLEGLKDINKSIYLKEEELLIYVNDELYKINRLIEYNEDYRSALLRAVGLNEMLLKARIVGLWINNQLLAELDNNSPVNRADFERYHKDLLANLDKELLVQSSGRTIIKTLRESRKLKIKLDDLEVKLHPVSIKESLMEKFWVEVSENSLKPLYNIFNLFELRNKAIHFCLSVSKETAELSMKMARENLREFEERWTANHLSGGTFEAPSWNELCEKCKIDFLPKRKEGYNA